MLENRRRGRENRRDTREDEARRGKGAKMKTGRREERRDFPLLCSLQWLHWLSLAESFIPRLLNAKSKN